MTNAPQQTFIRTQAEIFAWAAVASASLEEYGVLTQEESDKMYQLAERVVYAARQDPKFTGDKLPMEFK